MSELGSNKNHGSCVSNDTGPVSSMRPSAAWDIWDKVWRAKKNVFDRGGITGPIWLLVVFLGVCVSGVFSCLCLVLFSCVLVSAGHFFFIHVARCPTAECRDQGSLVKCFLLCICFCFSF